MKKPAFIVSLISLLMACKPQPIEINIRQADPKLVVYSQYVRDGLFAVSVTRSFPAQLANHTIDSTGLHIDSSVFVNDAEVWLRGTGVDIELEWLQDGIYATEQAVLENGQSYHVEVSNVKYGKAAASAIKLPMVRFDTIAVYTGKRNLAQSVDVYYSFTDNADEENYYVVNYFTKNNKEPVPQKPDADYIARRLLQQNVNFDLLSDKDFKNNKVGVYKNISTGYTGDTVVLGLSNISKGYFNFLEAQKKAGTLFNQLNTEVINFPTNISNGYGYVNMHEPDIRVLEVR